jgi:hypothetical protein
VLDQGTVHVDGTAGAVVVGDNDLVNAGTIRVTGGVLDLPQVGRTVTQTATATLDLASGISTVKVATALDVDGTVRGTGTVEGDLSIKGTLLCGAPLAMGRLTVKGALQMAPAPAPGKPSPARTVLHVESDRDVGGVDVTGQLGVNGALTVTQGAPPGTGWVLPALVGGAGTTVAGRFESATLPAPAGGLHFALEYRGPSVVLRAASVAQGFDKRDPPASDADLKAFVKASPYTWVGFYLRGPCHSNSWNAKRPVLTGLGVGVAVIFVGQQIPGAAPGCPGQTDLTEARGVIDADRAEMEALKQGFDRRGTWIYLDIERSPAGMTSACLAYVRAWVARMLAVGMYSPALYVHRADFAQIDATVTSAFQAAGRADRARYWIVGGVGGLAMDPPSRSGIPEATVWQYPAGLEQDDTYGGVTLHLDRDVSALPDPSAP